jgi:alanine racemase
MDQIVVDCGDDPIADGDEVILFGPGDRGEPTAEDWAQAAGTIAYEIVTRIGTRVPRVYVNEVVPEVVPGYEEDDVAQGRDAKRSGT